MTDPRHKWSRRQFLISAGAASLPLWLPGTWPLAQPVNRPQDVAIRFLWRKYLTLHGLLRVMATGKSAPPDAYAAAVEAYRRHLFLVPGREIWFSMESHIAAAESPEALRGQLTNVFPLSYRMFHLKPTGEAIAEAILQSMPTFEKKEWLELETRRQRTFEPALTIQFEPQRKKLMSFLMTSLNSSPVMLVRQDFHMVDRYINTGHHFQEIQQRRFAIVETRRFEPLELIETVVMLLAQMLDKTDQGNSRSALNQLRERQEILRLPNPMLFPRAVLYWTAGEAVRRMVDPSHQHVAAVRKIYERALRIFVPGLEEFWTPYLDGKLSLDEALNGMVRRVSEA